MKAVIALAATAAVAEALHNDEPCPEFRQCGSKLCCRADQECWSEWFDYSCHNKSVKATSSSAAPERPHLAQAWTALSKGDGLPNQVGLEHYIYEEKGDKYALQGHIFDYGASCKKIELNTPTGYIGKETNFAWGTYYINCDSVDCCYGGHTSTYPTRPDVKKWDINSPGPITSVEFKGIEDTTELNDNPVKSAEHWRETDKLPFTRGLNVTYHHYITRNSADIISHRIDFTAPSAQGSILYGNFTVQHNVTAFRDTFKIPDMCYPQGSGRGHALSCGTAKVEEWEKKYFKHSYATRRSGGAKQEVMV